MSFKKNKYQVIRNAISKELADIGYTYLQISAEADHWMLTNQATHESNFLVGNFKDQQVPGSYAKYADRLMETLLVKTIPWPIFIDPTGSNNVVNEYKGIMKPNAPKGNKVDLNPGDMLIYSGCELEHWREPFKGKLCGQVFLHYNHANGPFAKSNLYDKRPLLGVPKTR